MQRITRRGFLAGVTAAGAAATLPGCSDDSASNGAATTTTQRAALPRPEDAPFDTVVVLMMENRSFDHLLGWLPGADGRQKGLSFADTQGTAHDTWPLAPDWQGWDYTDPRHDWEAVAKQYADGACDGWLRTQPDGDRYPIGYYVADDLPVLAALAKGSTTLDHYFCSLLGPTWPNRFYAHCATTDIDITGLYPTPASPTTLPPAGVERPSKLELAIWDRLRDAGRTGAYYFFSEPMTGLFNSRRYDDISHPYSQFAADAAAGKLANLVFVDPDYGTIPELQGTSNDMHPHGSVKVGDAFIGEVYETLRTSPQWDRTVFIVNFDEHGGFYDHVVPPTVTDSTVGTGDGPHPDYRRLGFRVPCIVAGPHAAARVHTDGPYEHCSVLKMIEWRWGLEPMTDRDRHATNLAEVLDFSRTHPDVKLPTPTVPPTVPRPR